MSVTEAEAGQSHPTELLWNEFRGRLKGFILRRTRQPSDAEDILQDVFLRIHQHAHALKNRDALSGWAFQITRNAIADHYRRERKNEMPMTDEIESVWMPPATPDRDILEFSGCLHPMIHDLPAPHREALVLTELEGLSQAEAAHRVGLSLPGMKSRVQRARRQLKDLFLACCRVEIDPGGGVTDCSFRNSAGQACGDRPDAGC